MRNGEVAEWYYLYVDDVHNYLVYFMGTADVDDVVQETFVKAFTGWDTFKGRSNRKTWLFSIARNTAINHIRANSKAIQITEVDQISKQHSAESTAEEHETYQRIIDEINNMKADYRDVVLHRIVMGLSIAETADTLGWSKAKVKTTLHRALKLLRKSLTTSLGRGLAL